MWILSGNERSPDVTHYLLCNRDILVGRRTDIRLEDDKSISRTHACIRVTYPPEDVPSPTARGQVTLSDRSKYGTSVNGHRLDGDSTVTDGAVITFGLQWNTWTLSWRPLAVATSLLPHSERDALKELLAELGGTMLADWGPAVNYLVMSSFKMSVKAVLALASGTPVVTPQYLREMAVCARAGVAPDVNPTDFEPVLDEPTLAGSGCSIGVVRERSTLFFGRRFLFAEEVQLQRMKQAIELAGGTALLLASCVLTSAELTARDVIVMHTELKSPELNKLKAVLKRARRRLVKDQEIGLAILRNSTERDCNPAFDYRTSFMPPLASTQSQSMIGTVLARETQTEEQSASTALTSYSLTQATAEAGRQTKLVVPPTPATPSTILTPQSAAGGVVPPTLTPPTPSTNLTPQSAAGAAGGVVPPTPFTLTQSAAGAPGGVVPPTPSTPQSASGRSGRVSSPWLAVPSEPSAAVSRPLESDRLTGPDAKRPRRDPAAVTATGAARDTQELLTGPTTAAAGRRLRDSPAAEEAQSVFKRPRLSVSVRSRPAPDAAAAPDGEDLFDFDLELGSRPPPPPPPKVKREVPSPVPETPPSLEPRAPQPTLGRQQQRPRPVKSDPEAAADETWISSCRQTGPPPPPAPAQPDKTLKREQVSVAEDGDTSGLANSCIRLQISALICPRRPERDTTAAADQTSSVDGANFKRFRRVRQPPVCPRIIGGSDLFVGNKRRSGLTMGNGHAPSEDEGDLRAETRRQEVADDDMFRLLDGVGRGRSRRR